MRVCVRAHEYFRENTIMNLYFITGYKLLYADNYN